MRVKMRRVLDVESIDNGIINTDDIVNRYS